MTQYCTLEEAYNVPSFSRKRKSCKDPSSPADAYDAFTEQKGREQALYEKFTSDNTSSQKTGRGTGEDTAMDGGRKTYTSQMQDFNYICKTAGICLPGEKKTDEGFLDYEPVPPSKTTATKKDTKTPAQKCAPLNPPNYEFPMSEGDKQRFRKALNVALEEMEDSSSQQKYIPPSYEVRKVDMDKVSGYVDEELESYMSINEMKAEPTPKKIEPIPDSKLKDIPGLEKENHAVVNGLLSQDMDKNKLENFTKKNKIWMDLLLFIGSGILIIFLLEQLFKLALITGMKKTVEAIDMIIQEAKHNGMPPSLE